ncbi:unnamed protein product [Symbiodinium natans]|uniref:Uncharacterized protein n=1 Tax=Symbiodinium natans TaxID=878477 RepID=A0A812HHA6_9DINO|nr:unnamed protein product [Symbiodinium natans]
MTVKNDLPGAIEVDGQVLYPSRSLDVHGSLMVRLRDAPHIQGRGQGHRLSAAKDFGDFGRDARQWLLAEAQEVKRQARRHQEQKEHMERQAAREAMEKVRKNDKEACDCFMRKICVLCLAYLPAIFLLWLMAGGPPGDAALAGLLAFLALLLCFWLSFFVLQVGRPAYWRVEAPGWERCLAAAVLLAGALACACVTLMNVRYAQAGYWWTALIIWPCSCYSFALSFGTFIIVAPDSMPYDDEEALRAAQWQLRTRSIVFRGKVVEESGRPCVASWPGKYEAAWDCLVQRSREGETSAAVVFLPEGTPSYGKHSPIPAEEHITGECWCIPIYGERKPWGCLWWDKWIKNIEKAHACGAQLEVYYYEKSVGAGKVESFDTAGHEHIRRDEINSRWTAFQKSNVFKAAVAAGLDKLSKGTGRDSSSQYSREYRRLFLSWLPSEDRDFMLASEGLGNSQKAEVAWLDRKGYEYVEVDVSKWWEEYHVPVSQEVTPQAHPQGRGMNLLIPGTVELG